MTFRTAGAGPLPAAVVGGQEYAAGNCAPGAGRCSTDDCSRRARTDWAVCDAHASELLTAAFGRPVEGPTRATVDPPAVVLDPSTGRPEYRDDRSRSRTLG